MSGFFSRVMGGSASPATAAPETLADWFTADHQQCDALWAEVEGAGSDLTAVRAAFTAFDTRLRRHLSMEEEVLFPAFDQRSGMHGMGPTAVMRVEHTQMRGLLDQMARATTARDITNLGDTLLMVIQQHNTKEEGMLYPMAEQMLDWSALEPALARYTTV